MHATSRTAAALAALSLALAACAGDGDDTGYSPEDPATVTLLSHDSFVMPDEIVASLAEEGIELELLPGGDAGAVVNQAILSAGNPQGDVLFGIDSTLLTRGLEADLFEPYEAEALDQIPDDLELDDEHRVTPVDVSSVCINYDKEAYGDGTPVPETLDDLTDEAYAGQLVVENPATSSPGLAFLLRTIAEYGQDGWQDYWQQLVDNDVEVTAGWEDAYYGVFSGGASGEGDRPLVVSYATSPPAEVLYGPDPEAEEAPTGTMLDSCYRQVEFAGVLAGTDVPDAARRVVDVLVSPEFQATIPLNMFVHPAREDVELPEVFAKFADQPEDPVELDPATITEHREEWIEQWTELVLG